MKKPAVILLILSALLMLGACTNSHYLSLAERRQTKQSSSYRIARKIVGTSSELNPPTMSTWLEIQNHTPWKTRVTMDCRFYMSTPNRPNASVVRTFVLQPWQVRTEPFTAMSYWLQGTLTWCGMIDSDFVN